MSVHRIAVIAGDGIGQEVMPEGLRALEAAADRFGIGSAPKLISQVAAAVERWPEFATRAKVGEAEIRRIAQQFTPF